MPRTSLLGYKSLELINFDLKEIIEETDKLNSGKSPGLDGIYPRILKELKLEIA